MQPLKINLFQFQFQKHGPKKIKIIWQNPNPRFNKNLGTK